MRTAPVPLLQAVLTLVALAATGCPDPTCQDCPPIAFDVEVYAPDGTYVPLTDGAVVPWQWGLQGGTMLMPRIVFDPADVEEGTDVAVTIRHSPDPSAPERYGQVAEFSGLTQTLDVTNEDGRLAIGPLNDQLGWDELDGTRLTYEVEVSSSVFGTSTMTAVIELAPMSP
jgi:hypothetical protein